MRMWIALAACLLIACGGGPAPQPEAKTATQKPPRLPDHRTWFPLDGRTSFELVADHLMGKDWLPGGNVANYEAEGKRYTLFLAETATPDAAALLSYDIKNKLSNAKFVPTFGGQFGLDGDTPWFIFPKGKYVAGVVGLAQEQADAVARGFAGRVRAN